MSTSAEPGGPAVPWLVPAFALACGVGSLVLFFAFPIGQLLATVAIVLGLTRIRMRDQSLRLLAWGGVLCGALCWVGTGVVALFLVAV